MKCFVLPLILFIFVAFFFTYCKKTPQPCFTIDKTPNYSGDTMILSNCSIDGKNFIWDFGDDSVSVSTNARHIYAKGGVYTITLSENSINRNNAKPYITQQTITVQQGIPGCMDPICKNYNPLANVSDGSCIYIHGCMDSTSFNYNPNANVDDGSCSYPGKKTFYMKNPAYRIIELGIDGIWVGNDTIVYPNNPPDCVTSPGCIYVTGGSGTHTYDAVFYNQVGTPVKHTQGNFSITANVCELFLLD